MTRMADRPDGDVLDDPPITAVIGHPEAVFGVYSVDGTAGNATGAMSTGEWLRGNDGRTAYGALGVFIDTAVGSPAVAHRPPGAWAVTTDLSITFCHPPDVDGSDLVATSRTIFADHTSAVSDGEVTNARGMMVAKAVERVLFTPDQTISDARVAPGAIDRGGGNVMALLGGVELGDTVQLDVGRLNLNPVGNLHGGIAVYMSERAASSFVENRLTRVTPTALQMSCIRPGSSGSRLIFRCMPLHIGRGSAVIRVESRTSNGKLCTAAVVTYHRR